MEMIVNDLVIRELERILNKKGVKLSPNAFLLS